MPRPFLPNRHEFPIEVRDRPRIEGDVLRRPMALPDGDVMGAEVELDLEHALPIGDGGRRQAARAHVQGYLPPVVEEGRKREPDLADDLSPHVQRRGGIGLTRQGKGGPGVTRIGIGIHHVKHPHTRPKACFWQEAVTQPSSNVSLFFASFRSPRHATHLAQIDEGDGPPGDLR